MSSETKIEKEIIEGSTKGHKQYSFNETHDRNTPAGYWFQQSHEGLVLFIVFYTQACRWSQCLGCNLPSQMSQHHIDFKAIMAQIDYLFEIPEVKSECNNIKKVIVSNNGSVLDEDTFSSTALMYLLAKLNLHLPFMSSLSIETRPEYIDLEELEFLYRALQEGDTPAELEICIGFEAFDNIIRNDVFKKGLSLETFEELVQKITRYKYRLKCYFMLKPVPGMSNSDAVNDIHNAIDYLSSIQSKYGNHINIHLNPTFAAKGTILEEEFLKGNYSPPELIDVAKAAYHARDKGLSVFIGLSDEGLAVEGGSFIRKGEEDISQKLEDFNKTENYTILERLLSK